MNNLFEYLLSVSLATTVLYLVFLLLFRKDTFLSEEQDSAVADFIATACYASYQDINYK